MTANMHRRWDMALRGGGSLNEGPQKFYEAQFREADSHEVQCHAVLQQSQEAPFREEDMHEVQCHAALQQQYKTHGDRQAATTKTGCYSHCHVCSIATVQNPHDTDSNGTSGAPRPTGRGTSGALRPTGRVDGQPRY